MTITQIRNHQIIDNIITAGKIQDGAISRLGQISDGFITPAKLVMSSDFNFGGALTVQAPAVDLAPATKKYVDNSLVSANAYADSKVSDLLGGAPAALDTLNELAAAIGDDANYAGSVTASISNLKGSTVAFHSLQALESEVSTIKSSVSSNLVTAQGYATTAKNEAIAHANNVSTTAKNDAISHANTVSTTAKNEAVSHADSVSATALSDAKSYADSKVSALIDGAPAALDTLNEIAASLGDDANYASTITNLVSTTKTNLETKIDDAKSIHTNELAALKIDAARMLFFPRVADFNADGSSATYDLGMSIPTNFDKILVFINGMLCFQTATPANSREFKLVGQVVTLGGVPDLNERVTCYFMA